MRKAGKIRAGKIQARIGSNPDLCSAGAVFYQLSYQANWELGTFPLLKVPTTFRVRNVIR